MTPTISSTTKRTQLPAEVLQLEGTFIQGRGSSAMIKISHSMTSDCLGGQPWPPPDRDVLWAVVRHADGCTLWRAIQLVQVRSAAVEIFPTQSAAAASLGGER